MKMFKITLFLLCTLLCKSAVKAEAKIEAKPFEAEQNFRLLQKTMETAKLDPDFEGSGDDLEDYYDDDDDYYDPEDYEDDYGSGEDQDWLPHEVSEEKAKLVPDNNEEESDFHFSDNDHKVKAYDNLLYEYYTDSYYPGEDDYLDQIEQDLEENVQDLDHDVHVIVTKPEGDDKYVFQPSYIFLMLTSALISFAIFILAFILCRRSASRHHKKANMVPFIVSSTDHFSSKQMMGSSSPIVKNYQRVPTSTKELMMQQHSVAVEMQQNQSERPLLT